MKKRDILWCIVSLALSTAVAFVFSALGFSDANLIMIYILGVLMVALLTGGYVWGIISSILGVLTFNFFFAEPIFTFSVYNPDYLITFVVMFATSITCSVLTKRVKNYAAENARKSYRSELLLQASRSLQEASTSQEILQKTVKQLGKLLEKKIYCLMGKPENWKMPKELLKEDRATALWCYQHGEDAGFSTDVLRESPYMFLAVKGKQKTFAVIVVDTKKEAIGTFERGIVGTIIHECVFALEKEELLNKQREAEMRLEKEQLRANLLRSISHDLRSPLTSISGNAENLLANEEKLPAGRRREIYRDIYDDSKWLINLVENLLSITRIENGNMKLDMQGEIVEEVIEEALKHVNFRGKDQSVVRVECDEILMAKMDLKLMLQVIINLVDNAVKYTPKNAEILIKAEAEGDKVILSVRDNGTGLTPEQKEKVFDMYYTVNRGIGDARRGMGLGLPLCQAIVKAHGSRLEVCDNTPKGTVFKFALSKEEILL